MIEINDRTSDLNLTPSEEESHQTIIGPNDPKGGALLKRMIVDVDAADPLINDRTVGASVARLKNQGATKRTVDAVAEAAVEVETTGNICLPESGLKNGGHRQGVLHHPKSGAAYLLWWAAPYQYAFAKLGLQSRLSSNVSTWLKDSINDILETRTCTVKQNAFS
jgi:hypothetical protein